MKPYTPPEPAFRLDANERHAGLMLAVVDRDMIIKQYAAAMKRGEA